MLKQVYRVFEKNHGKMNIEVVPVGAHKGQFAEKPLSQNALTLRQIFLNKRSRTNRGGYTYKQGS